MDVGMVFGIILSVIVIVVLLGYGLNAILGISATQNAAQIRNAVADLETRVDNVANFAEGSTLTHTLRLPASVTFCFVNPADPGRAVYPEPDKNWLPDPGIGGIITEEGYTLWTIDESTGEENGYVIAGLVPAGGNFCAGSGATLFLENQGLMVAVSG